MKYYQRVRKKFYSRSRIHSTIRAYPSGAQTALAQQRFGYGDNDSEHIHQPKAKWIPNRPDVVA